MPQICDSFLGQPIKKNAKKKNSMHDLIWKAEGYRDHSSIQSIAAAQLLEHVQLKGNEKILDVGCGDGKITAALSRRVPSGFALGLDISSEMINYAQKIFPQDSYPNLKFLLKDATQFEFTEEFDIIFSSFVLHWVVDLNGFVA